MQIKQFRYYGDQSSNNYPTSLTKEDLCYGNIFSSLGGVTHLGIQAQPGTIFYLNEGPWPIAVGSTGIYELCLNNNAVLTAIQFKESTLNHLNGIIIDVICEVGL